MNYKYSGDFTVIVRNYTSYLPKTELHFYKGLNSILPINSYHIARKEIKMPNGKIIETYNNDGYVLNNNEEYSGEWSVTYHENNGQSLRKNFLIIFEEKIIPLTTVIVDNKSIKFRCETTFINIHQCSFEGPSGLIINDDTTSNDNRFTIEITNLGLHRDQEYSSCELIIHDFNHENEGLYKCSLRDDIQTANGTVHIERNKSIVEIYTKIGTAFFINCTNNDEWEKCRISSPNDIYQFTTNSNSQRQINHSAAKGNGGLPCFKKIEKAEKKHNGNWTCNVFNKIGNNIFKTFIVRITDDFAIGDIKYNFINGINRTILQARYPTDDTDIMISQCKWSHPVDDSYLNDHYYYTMTNIDNVCQLIINYPQEHDRGNWSCFVKAEFGNGTYDISGVSLNVNVLDFHKQFNWWYIFLGIIIILIILVIIIVLIIWKTKKEKKAKRFDKYFYGDLNRTKKIITN